MASVYSDPSQVSYKSQQVLDSVSVRSQQKISKLTGVFDDEDLRSAWNAFGLYVSRQLRQGRAVAIPQFGIFTFTAPDVTLAGVSNPWERDKQLRNPVFIIGKDFAQGYPLKSGICQGGNIRPYKVHGINGKIAQTKINFTEIGIYSNKTKDQAQQAVYRVIRQLSDDSKGKSSVDMEIPNVGVFRIRNQVVAIQFNDFLNRDAKMSTNNFKTVQQKKEKLNSNLTIETIKRFENYKNMSESLRDYDDRHLEIDDKAKTYLRNEMAIDVNRIMTPQQNKSTFLYLRPQSSQQRESQFYAPSLTSTHSRLNQNQSRYGGSKQSSWIRGGSSVNLNQRAMTAKMYKSTNQLNPRTKRAEIDIAFRQLKIWIREECLNAEDSFLKVAKAGNGNSNAKSKLTTDGLFNAIRKLKIPVDAIQIQELFRKLDYNKDGLIDQNDWVIVISEASNAYLQRIKDIIQKFQISTQDLLLTMKLKRSDKALNLVQLKDALKRLDQTLDDYKATSAAKALLNETDTIDVEDIIEEIGFEQEKLDNDGNDISESWYQQTLARIYNKLANSDNSNALRDQFEKMDIENYGRIHFIKFKTCLYNTKLGLTKNEINRIVRFQQIDQSERVDYHQFLKEMIKNGQKIEEEIEKKNNGDVYNYEFFYDLQDFYKKITEFMKRNNLESPIEFLDKVKQTLETNEIKLTQFATFLFKKAFKNSNEEEILIYVKKMDIDNDGIISNEDISTFFQRRNYLEEQPVQKTNNFISFSNNLDKTRNTPFNPKQEPLLYPIVQLDQNKIDVLIREIKQKLYLKKMSFYDFFKNLDENQDGFITIDEWGKNLDQVIKYSKEIQDGLFTYFDRMKIGMIDYQSFLKALEVQGDITDKQLLQANEEWENVDYIIGMIKEWFQQENLSVEDAFRVIDHDFDGLIGKNDIEYFLKKVLNIPVKEVTKDRINRVFKLMDEYKRGKIELTDLKRLLQEKRNQNDNFAVTGGKFTQGRDSLDWRLNAKQQIGLVLSRKFNSLEESYEKIAQNKPQLIYKQFLKWITDSKALVGFDLSDYQIQMVFSDIDPHKKGYLSERDWISAFSGFNWKGQMLIEIQDTAMTHFKDFDQAYGFFSQGNQLISKQHFTQAIKTLFKDRFTTKDINSLWKQLVPANSDKEGLDRDNFVAIYDETKPQKKLPPTQTFNNTFKPKSSANQLTTQSFMEANFRTSRDEFQDAKCDQIVKKVRQVLRASNKSIEQIFKEFDKDGSGHLSNIEFKNAFRGLNIGLTSREIDYLLNYCDESGDGFVDWGEFLRKFKLGDAQTKILDRSKNRLQEINDNIHYYMLSPKDAFRLFNEDRSGLMNYNDFAHLMSKLYQMANQPLPSFAIIKDIFQTIDIRKDGVIDMSEWTQTFKQFQPPNASMQGRPMMHQEKQENGQKQQKQQKEESNPLAYHIEASQEYDKIMLIIGRNRKFLLQTFNDINKFKPVTFNVAKEVLEKLFNSTGIKLEKDHYPLIIKFAERDGIVDYRFMLEVYKERIQRISQQPDPYLA